MDQSEKQRQFNTAMELYTTRSRYKVITWLVSVANIGFQIHLVCRLWPVSIGPGSQLFTITAAMVITDFVNGLVHLYMDQNDHYQSLAGPLIANFHMHHKIPQYTKRNLLTVYFNESGSKVWLVVYLLAVSLFMATPWAAPLLSYLLVYVGILSSLAEVSHYLCHSSTSAIWEFLAKLGLGLSKRHHARHHLENNLNYAFLNGCTDPLLNLIAAHWSEGYKTTTDMHFAAYHVGQDDSR